MTFVVVARMIIPKEETRVIGPFDTDRAAIVWGERNIGLLGDYDVVEYEDLKR